MNKQISSSFIRPWLSASGWDSPVPAHALGLFRILFGLLMTWEIIYFIRIDFVGVFLSSPMVQFTYPGFSWLGALPDELLWGLIGMLLLSTVLITLGIWFRWVMLFFALGFTYLFLLDQAYCNNHLYLICLLSGWMAFLPMDAALTPRRAMPRPVPAACYAILRAHIVLVYFFGGIAKINPDWLFQQQPVRLLVSQTPFLSNMLGEEITVYLLTYGGLVFDLIIGALLLYRPTRTLGFVGALIFNGLNAVIFNDINIFPFFMIGSLVLFFEPSTVANWFRTAKRSSRNKKKELPSIQPIWGRQIWVQRLFIGYLIFHLLWPFRHLAIPGPVDWTGQGQQFAWRMKIQTRVTDTLELEVLDYRTKTIIPIDLDAYLPNIDQKSVMAQRPQALMLMVDYLKTRASERLRHDEVGVRARVKVRFNGRPAQWMVDPETDLARETYRHWGRNEWILPLQH